MGREINVTEDMLLSVAERGPIPCVPVCPHGLRLHPSELLLRGC